LTSTLPGDWHLVPVGVATQLFIGGLGAAKTAGAAISPAAAAAAAKIVVAELVLGRMVVLLLYSPELDCFTFNPDATRLMA
jgi:hypothetical protein